MFSIELWAAILILVDLLIILILLYWWRNVNHGFRKAAFRKAADQVFAMIEPLLKESDTAAKAFEKQLRNKKDLIHNLNESLDSRIISLNLLLNRAELLHKPGEAVSPQDQPHVYDQLTAITKLYDAGKDAVAISEQLAMPRGEVDLVLDLKKKLLALA